MCLSESKGYIIRLHSLKSTRVSQKLCLEQDAINLFDHAYFLIRLYFLIL